MILSLSHDEKSAVCFGVSTETNQWLVIGLYLAIVVAVAAYDTQMNITHELFDNDPNNRAKASGVSV